MNNFYGGFDRVAFETPEEKLAKKKRLKKLFSRTFLALFLYAVTSYCAAIGIYAVAHAILSPEKYEALCNNYALTILFNYAAQYLIAFPVLLLSLIGTEKATPKEKTKLSLSDFIFLFLIGQSAMFVGNYIGTYLNQLIGNLTGTVPENSIANMIAKTPIWLVFAIVVVIGPIIEELIFRKIVIDRISIYGDRVAIIFSAVAFGFMHCNLYQFFYATLLGIVFGYVYTATRDVRYTIAMHMLVNFINGLVALPVERAIRKFYELIEVASLGEKISFTDLFTSGAITITYTNMHYGMIIGGVIALVHFIRKKKIRVSSEKEVFLPNKEIYKHGILNVGAILFVILTVMLTVFNTIYS